MIELTKRETQVLLYAVGLALEKERKAVEMLNRETHALGITQAIVERTKQLAELDRLRERLTLEN